MCGEATLNPRENKCCLLCAAVALAHTLQIGADQGNTRLSSVSTKIHEDVHILRPFSKIYLSCGAVKIITSLPVPGQAKT